MSLRILPVEAPDCWVVFVAVALRPVPAADILPAAGLTSLPQPRPLSAAADNCCRCHCCLLVLLVAAAVVGVDSCWATGTTGMAPPVVVGRLIGVAAAAGKQCWLGQQAGTGEGRWNRRCCCCCCCWRKPIAIVTGENCCLLQGSRPVAAENVAMELAKKVIPKN
jgi:hypothetical protein